MSAKDISDLFKTACWTTKFSYRILVIGGVTPFSSRLKTTSTIAFQQAAPRSSTHRHTPD
jgi:hypothetical protein